MDTSSSSSPVRSECRHCGAIDSADERHKAGPDDGRNGSAQEVAPDDYLVGDEEEIVPCLSAKERKSESTRELGSERCVLGYVEGPVTQGLRKDVSECLPVGDSKPNRAVEDVVQNWRGPRRRVR